GPATGPRSPPRWPACSTTPRPGRRWGRRPAGGPSGTTPTTCWPSGWRGCSPGGDRRRGAGAARRAGHRGLHGGGRRGRRVPGGGRLRRRAGGAGAVRRRLRHLPLGLRGGRRSQPLRAAVARRAVLPRGGRRPAPGGPDDAAGARRAGGGGGGGGRRPALHGGGVHRAGADVQAGDDGAVGRPPGGLPRAAGGLARPRSESAAGRGPHTMAEQTTQQMVVGASPQRTWEVPTDIERYPAWATDLKEVHVDSRDEEGRPLEVTFRAAAMGRSTTYRLRYDYTKAPEVLAW